MVIPFQICYVEESQRDKVAMHRCRGFSTIKWRSWTYSGLLSDLKILHTWWSIFSHSIASSMVPERAAKSAEKKCSWLCNATC
ncbi:hypothetical protein V3C99_003385 [Haemonchus contortus]